MKNSDLIQNQFQVTDPIENYFECISSCDMRDSICIYRCVEILKEYED